MPRYDHSVERQAAFWARVDKTSTCWLWTRTLTSKGYGTFYVGAGVKAAAHRYSWEIAGRELIDGLVLDHLCRVRNCVNPDHLEQVTDQVNILRGVSRVAQRAGVTHCPAGHPYSGENLIQRGHRRECRECERIRSVEKRWRAGSKPHAHNQPLVEEFAPPSGRIDRRRAS